MGHTDIEQFVQADGRDDMVKQVRKKIDELGVEYLYLQFVSITGRICGKGIPSDHWKSISAKGFQLVYGAAVNLFTNRHGDYLGYGPEAAELVGVPEPETFCQLPWDKRVARVWCTLFRNREERENPGAFLTSDSRGNLRRLHNDFQARHGLHLRAGTEPEMMWLKKDENGKPNGGFSNPYCYHIDQFESLRPVYMKVLEYGDTAEMARHIEEIDGVEILSLGSGLELIKDLGDAGAVCETYNLDKFRGTHAIGHTRMATESDVDIRSAHPYWAFPYNDVSVVHNGQITNYWMMRREMERQGHRFMSDCDSELLAVYTAHNLANGASLEDSLKASITEIDGVFTYLVASKDQLGLAKDTMAAKPLVLYESDDLIAMASEEVAIRAILPHEIDTYDEEVRVWQA